MSATEGDPSTNSLLGNLIRDTGIDQIAAAAVPQADGIDIDDVVDVLQRQPSYEPVWLPLLENIFCSSQSAQG